MRRNTLHSLLVVALSGGAAVAAPPAANAPASVAPASSAGPGATAASVAPAIDPEAAFAARRWADAQAGYAQAVEARPDAPNLRYRHAVAAALAGRVDIAEASAASVVRLDPGNEPARLLAAGARALRRRKVGTSATLADVEQALRDGRLRTAARLAGRALSSADSDAERSRLYAARGRALLALGRANEAAVALKAAAGLGEASAPLWMAVGRAFGGLGRLPAAASSLEAAAETAEGPLADEARARGGTLKRLNRSTTRKGSR